MQEFGFRAKTRAQEAIERRDGIDLPAYLRTEYHDKGRRLADIASDLGLDTGTVSRWMDQFGIDRRVRTQKPAAVA